MEITYFAIRRGPCHERREKRRFGGFPLRYRESVGKWAQAGSPSALVDGGIIHRALHVLLEYRFVRFFGPFVAVFHEVGDGVIGKEFFDPFMQDSHS